MTDGTDQAFEQLLENCADEPIQYPGAIQPHGVLMTLSEPGFEVRQVSRNVGALLGLEAAQVLGKTLTAVIGQRVAKAVRQAVEAGTLDELTPIPMKVHGTEFEGFLHRHQGLLILEMEVRPRSVGDQQAHLSRLLQRLQAAKSLDELYEASVREIQRMTGYDRVLIYRFEEQGHGQVMAEASSPGMELFKGLFFPASDIPPQARQLYQSNWLRIIPNAAYQPVPLVPTLRPDTQTPLDLSFATLRSVSPIHCQYMQNMGVLSSMSISLLKGGKLWGLISCGHRQPLHVPSEMRSACKTIGQVLSLQISALESLQLAAQREEKLQTLHQLGEAMAANAGSVFDGLAENAQVLMDLVGAGGVAIIDGTQLRTAGVCPSAQQVRDLHQWITAQARPVFASHALSSIYPQAGDFCALASGVLAFTLPKPIDNGVLWFRPEVKETINWSGDPSKPLQLEPSENGLRLRPRTSFEIWKVEMEGISRPWGHGDQFAANDLRRSALEFDLARQVLKEQAAVRARDELVAVVSHDLRNPMTVISMLCGMLQKSFSSDGPNASRRITSAISTMQQATSRMNVLLDDLLDTSRIEAGRYTIAPQPLDVSHIFEEAYTLLAPLALNKSVELSFHAEPGLVIHADPERLFQVLSNLIGNAIKFTPAEGRVGVVAMSDGEQIVFSVRDTGKGIPAEQLPHVFDRYWTAREGNPSGTGLGLYISQGIIQAHGGVMQAASEPGQGSEFRFTLPKPGV
ncbi:ATP-binding protein [Pseudomonas fontis]|uniref:histidine kinase n=1 Tax=Pseudomonas fontis TaxID=2942633 RepID=A0ABT5NNM4_9PSED|nr:ATP-binding protein [Pseudomonas fontis]MDD0973010.1 ATP-binding protein [Pseudomonas fontis]MDD0989779.1 ATP-binding protein [Pseudomonas fontis]